MPRYFFQVEDSAFDNEGTELENLAIAKCDAVKFAAQIIRDDASTFWDKEEWKMTVTDENGLTLFSLMFVGAEAAAISAKA